MSIQIVDDPWLSATLVVDRAGFAKMPGCGSLAAAGLDAEEIGDKIAAGLVSSGAYDERPELLVTIVDRVGKVTLVVGPNRGIRPVPFEPGITLIQALSVGLAGPLPRQVVLHRKNSSYEISVQTILEGSQSDEPLERGDEVHIDTEVAIRREAPFSERSPSTGFTTNRSPDSDLGEAECGELLLEEVALGTLRMGPHHPRVVQVSDAVANRCSKETVTSSLRGACFRARQERTTASLRYSPAHPRMRMLDAQLGICPAPAADAQPEPDCASLHTKRRSLVASGKGDRHPLTIALSWRLESCR